MLVKERLTYFMHKYQGQPCDTLVQAARAWMHWRGTRYVASYFEAIYWINKLESAESA